MEQYLLDPNNPSLLSWIFTVMLLLSIFWALPWKGVALWKAARNNHLKWFIALLIINTMAVLEIIYIFGFSKKPRTRTSSVRGEKKSEEEYV